MLERCEQLVDGNDPVLIVTWTIKIKKLEIEMNEFMGDISGIVSWKGKKVFFTTRSIHPTLNKIPEYLHNRWENMHQDFLYNEEA